MFLRVVRTKLREGALWRFREYYEERILPALEKTEGCLYAALLRPTADSAARGLDSLTLWESAAHADAYVSSGLYDDLLDGADPFLAAAATEWKADLTPTPSGPATAAARPRGRHLPGGGGAGHGRRNGGPGPLSCASSTTASSRPGSTS